MIPLLTIDAVEKRFGSIPAVDRLSFSVAPGEVFALLGPNGAGKTTTVRMILDILRPDAGTIRFSLPGRPEAPPAPADIGYLPEDRGLYKDIPIRKTLLYMAALRGFPRRTAGPAADLWLDRMNLADRAHDRLDTLSKGNQQKVQIISAVLHKPLLAILDEPFAGLDPLNQEFVLDCIRSLRAEGMTILLSAHQMNLVERIADRILLVNHGRELLSGTLAGLQRTAGRSTRIIITPEGRPDPSPLRTHPAVERLDVTEQGEICVVLHDSHTLNGFLESACRSMNILGLRSEHLTLHDIVVDAVRRDDERSAREEAA